MYFNITPTEKKNEIFKKMDKNLLGRLEIYEVPH